MAEGTAPSAPLKVVGGFELIEKIGQGAMGAVFKAHQRSLDRVVALKVLPPSIAKDTQFIDRFQREARASARFTHPNIVLGIDVGKDEKNGLWYFAMEYVDGPSVGQMLKKEGPLPEMRALEIARDVAKALECAASHQMVHRDVKPDNILLSSRGEVKLADLGLARRVGGDDASLTQAGQAIGTPNYMAPEQIRGQLDQVDIRSDLYALGCTLFHMLTGHPPFQGETTAVTMAKHLSEPPPSAHRLNPDISEPCSRLIVRLMQKTREQRIQSPTALVTEIERLLNPAASRRQVPIRGTTGPRAAVRPVSGAPVTEATNRSAKAFLIGIAVAVLVGGGVLAAFLLSDPDKTERRTATGGEKATHNPPIATPAPLSHSPQAPVPPVARPVAPDPVMPPAVTSEETPERKIETPPVKDNDTANPATKEEPAPADVPPPATEEKGTFIGEIAPATAAANAVTGTAKIAQPTLNFNWPKGAPEGMALGTGVSGKCAGSIQPAEGGPHVFELTATMSCRLYLNEYLLLDLWNSRGTARTPPLNLEQGKRYSVRMELASRRAEATAGARWGPARGPLTPMEALSAQKADGLPQGQIEGGWSAEYSSGTAEAGVTLGRHEWTLCHEWGGGSPAVSIPVDQFRGKWNGIVVPPKTGDYIFHLDADEGGRVFFGGLLILDNRNGPRGLTSTSPIRLEQGKRYAANVEYFERNYDAKCKFTWTIPNAGEQPVLATGTGDGNLTILNVGFLVEHAQGGTAQLQRREIQVGWNWGGGSPDSGLLPDSFSSVYTGWILPPVAGVYTFNVQHNGPVRFYLDDVLVLSNVKGRVKAEGGTADEISVPLAGGKYYFLRMVYRARTYDDLLRVAWRANGVPEQIVSGIPPDVRKSSDNLTGRIENALLAEWGTGREPLVRRLEGRICHDFGGGAPDADVQAEGFWGRWSGGLTVPESGKYQFRVECDNTAEVKLNRVSVLKTAKEGKGESQLLALQKGTTYFLEMSYQHRAYDANVRLLWRGPGKPEYEVVPTEAFVLPPAAKNMPRLVP